MLWTNLLSLVAVAQAAILSPRTDLEAAAADKNKPTKPGYTFLYSMNATLSGVEIDMGQNNLNHRYVYQIIGGTFKGPKLKGTVLNLGADWGYEDRDGLFHPDTRYNLKTDDGANIYIRTEGPSAPDGRSLLRITLESGHPNYYWLNNVIAVGVLHSPDVANYVLIDAWQVNIPEPY